MSRLNRRWAATTEVREASFSCSLSLVSCQLSVVSVQLSAVSLAIARPLSVFRFEAPHRATLLSVVRCQARDRAPRGSVIGTVSFAVHCEAGYGITRVDDGDGFSRHN